MATHIKFQQKDFSKVGKIAKETGTYISKHPTLPLVGASLAVATGNLTTNVKKRDEGREYQERQLKAMEKLTNSLGKVDKSLQRIEDTPKPQPKDKKSSIFRPMVTFKKKKD